MVSSFGQSQELLNAASVISENCPTQIDNNTIWESIIAVAPNTLLYKYKLLDSKGAGVKINDFDNKEKEAINMMKSAHAFKPMRDRNVIMQFMYFGVDGYYIDEFKIKPEDYN